MRRHLFLFCAVLAWAAPAVPALAQFAGVDEPVTRYRKPITASGTVTEQKNTAGSGLTTSGNCDNTSTNAASPCNYALTTGRLTNPTTQTFLTGGGSGTYTTPANVLWIHVKMVGGGGGGAGASGAGTAGGNGGNTCWNTSGAACTSPVYQAGGGGGGAAANGTSPTAGGFGGTVSGSGLTIGSLAGGSGQGAGILTGTQWPIGPAGGNSCLGGAGADATGAGEAGKANTGGGGQAGTGSGSATNVGGGGGAGACDEFIITSPAASYTYAVGAAGSAGGGTNNAGGVGGTGGIWVDEHYGS